jgi:hypothetical protein
MIVCKKIKTDKYYIMGKSLRTLLLVYRGLSLTVSGDYYKGHISQDIDQPDDEPEFEITEVLWQNVDITDVFDALGDWDELNSACFPQL